MTDNRRMTKAMRTMNFALMRPDRSRSSSVVPAIIHVPMSADGDEHKQAGIAVSSFSLIPNSISSQDSPAPTPSKRDATDPTWLRGEAETP